MTFLELCKAVRQECGVQGQNLPTAVIGQTGLLKRIVDWVVEADNIVQTKYSDWDFLWAEFTEDTAASSASVAKPADFGMWDKGSFALNRGTATGKGLNFIEYKDWQRSNYLKTNQEPSSITVLPNGNLALSAPADDVYEVYGIYWKTPTVLTSETDTPAFPVRFHRVIVARAKMFFFEDQEAWENYNAAKAEYDLKLNELEGFAAPGQQFRSQAQPPLMATRVE